MNSENTKQVRKSRRLWWLLVPLLLVAAGGGYYLYRYVYSGNFGVVVLGKVYRGAQPSERLFRKWIAENGIRTVINLRGDAGDDTAMERRLAKELNVQFVTINLSARDFPPRSYLMKLADVLDTAPQPILIHCNQGVDRTGLGSMMAAWAIGGESYEQAKAQLAPEIWEMRSEVHISDILDHYEAYCREHKLNPDNWPQFKRWLADGYSPDLDGRE